MHAVCRVSRAPLEAGLAAPEIINPVEGMGRQDVGALLPATTNVATNFLCSSVDKLVYENDDTS